MISGTVRIFSQFKIPIAILAGIGVFLFLNYVLFLPLVALVVAALTIFFGSFELFVDLVKGLAHKQFALDYIALLAIIASILAHEYLVAMVIVLMFSGGDTLEKYGLAKARQSLTALTERIPNEVVLWNNGHADQKKPVELVGVGEEVLVRKGEVIPLDGILISEEALTDESSLTGEPYMMDKIKGDQLRSGTVNAGNVLVLKVTKVDADSTYRKIVRLVQSAQEEKAPLVRLANRYSLIFTVFTLAIAIFAYVISHDFDRVLAVLVVATPCPLILATPIALFGGMNAAAKKRVLVKKLASLEVLSRVTSVIFDKTGTITLGQPLVSKVTVLDTAYSLAQVYSIAEALERNSLHPLAKAIVDAAHKEKAKKFFAEQVEEKIGSGITAVINNKIYTLAKMTTYHHSAAVELHEGDTKIARFEFEDTMKDDAGIIITQLEKFGLSLYIFTGDKEENAAKLIARLGEIGKSIVVKARCTPEDKKNGIDELRRRGAITAMVGDGINDAPALAMADVGMVFSNEEHTAASEAADIIFLGGDLTSVTQTIAVARRTIQIALQSIKVGIGLSCAAMVVAAFGYLPPLLGALLQEGIDILVIFNALRASRG